MGGPKQAKEMGSCFLYFIEKMLSKFDHSKFISQSVIVISWKVRDIFMKRKYFCNFLNFFVVIYWLVNLVKIKSFFL